MNLHLYIPPSSAHPPGVLRSLIFGLLRKYYLQNFDTRDFIDITTKFFHRLLDRDHSPQKLHELFLLAAQKLDKSSIPNYPPPTTIDTSSHAQQTRNNETDKQQNKIYVSILPLHTYVCLYSTLQNSIRKMKNSIQLYGVFHCSKEFFITKIINKHLS